MLTAYRERLQRESDAGITSEEHKEIGSRMIVVNEGIHMFRLRTIDRLL